VPSHLLKAGQPSPAHFFDRVVVTTYGYQDLFGRPSDIDQIVQRLRPYSLSHVLAVLARMDAILASAKGRHSEDRQQTLVARLFPSRGLEVAAAYARVAAAEKRTVLFHPRQLINAAKIALLALPYELPRPQEVNLDSLGEALLMVTDIIEAGVADSESAEQQRRQLEMYVFANSLFHRTPDIVHEVVRSYNFFLSKHPRLTSTNDPDLGEWARELLGINPDAFWFGLFAIFGWFFSLDLPAIDQGQIFVSTERFFDSFPGFPREQQERIFDATTIDMGQLQSHVQKDYTLHDLRPYDVLPFARNPLVRIGKSVFAPSLNLLQQALGTGLQYRFLDENRTTPAGRERFLRFRGRLVEDAVDQQLVRMFGGKYIDERHLQEEAGGGKTCDGLVLCRDTVILFECKASLVHSHVRRGQDWDRFLNLLKRSYLDAADQLLAVIQMAKAGRLEQLGLFPEVVRHYLPVVITLEVPMSPFTYELLVREGLGAHRLSAEPRVAPLQCMDLEEFELTELAVTTGTEFDAIFEEKLTAVGGPGMPFRNFWHERKSPWLGPSRHSPYLEAEYHALARRQQDFFKARGKGEQQERSGDK